jgi:zinc protease
VILLLAVQAFALDVEHRLLPNGLRIYVAENHNAPVFTMRVYIKAGSIYEDEFLGCGISHYLEHLVSGGTTHKRSEEDARQMLSEIGGASNAYTTSGHTCYYIATSAEYMDTVIDLLSDWVLNCALKQEEVDREHGVIMREIAMGMDEPGRRIGKLYNGTMFVEHPEHFPTIGYTELFEKLTRDDVVRYYERMYVPANMHVVAVGDFDAAEAMEKIDAAFSIYPYRAPASIFLPVDPVQLGGRHVEDEMDINLTHMTIGWRTVKLTHEDAYPLQVLARILGDGRSSRLYKRVKDELDLVHTIDASSYNPEYDAADFTVHVSCDYEKAAEAREAIRGVLYDVKDKYVTMGEIEKAKTQIASDLAFDFQDVQDQAGTIGIDVLRTGNPNYTEYYLEQIAAVTQDDIRRVANRYFYDDAMTVAVLKPTGAVVAQAERAAEVKQASDVEKVVLGNGSTLLLKEDSNVPLVHLRAYFRGGSSMESEETNGSFYMMSRMLRRGTRKRSADAIAEAVDGMGGRLYSGASEDYFNCSMDILSESFDEGLALMADILMNSTFSEAEFEKERQTVISILKSRDDDWQEDAEVRLRKILYGNHPYGLDSRGEQASVENLSRADVYDLYKEYCTPDNMVLAVFGDIDKEYAEAAVAKAFGRFNREGAPVPDVPDWPGLGDDIMHVEPTDKQQAVIFMGYPGMDAGSEDWYAMRVLDAVISGIGYPGGWLHGTLRGQQLVYLVHAWNYTLRGRGYVAVIAATQPATADTALAIIREKVEKIKTEYVTDEELANGKRICNIMEDLYYSQTTAAQANLAAQYETIGLGYDHRYQLKEKINAITKEEVQEVARKYLNESAAIMIMPEAEEYETSMN